MSNCLRLCFLVVAALLFPADGAASVAERGTVGSTGSAPTDLVVTKSGTPNPVEVGQTLTYTIIVTNEGPLDATGVTIEDTLPAAFTLTSVSVAGCTQVGTVLTCPVGDVGNGAAVTITLAGTPTATGPITNTVIVEGNQLEGFPADNTAVETTNVVPAGAVGVPLLDWRGLLVMVALMAIAGMTIRH
jgi:uncharacterized repeat protein (TIGR01451 family)